MNMFNNYNAFFMFYDNMGLPNFCDAPPTIFSILDSAVNFGKSEDEKVKTSKIAEVGREIIFNFEYPLTDKISKKDFEKIILNHFLFRRIGTETVSSFVINLNVKMNEIMPIYNKMFDAFENWDIFNDGEKMERTGNDNQVQTNNSNMTNTSNNNVTSNVTDISDRRYSDTPQSQLNEVQNGNYMTNYSYDTNKNNSSNTSNSNSSSNATSNTNNKNNYNEIVKKTQSNKIEILKEMQENIKSIYSLIFKDLEDLFYQLA